MFGFIKSHVNVGLSLEEAASKMEEDLKNEILVLVPGQELAALSEWASDKRFQTGVKGQLFEELRQALGWKPKA